MVDPTQRSNLAAQSQDITNENPITPEVCPFPTNPITPVPVPTKEQLMRSEIEFIVKQAKRQNKNEAAALDDARKENARLAKDGFEKLTDDGLKKIVKGEYGRKLFLSTGVMSTITQEVITWAVKNVLLKAALNLFIGDPDIGKSFVAIHYIAKLSCDGKKSVVLCREDSYSHVWVPRLKAAGADLSLVIPVFGVQIDGEDDLIPWMLDNPEHLVLLQDLLLSAHAELCLIDPLADFAGSKDLNKAQDVRNITGHLTKIAQQTQVAMLANCHTTKAIQDSVIKTAAGSYQLMAAVAVAWYFMEDQDNPSRRLMMQARNKYGTKRGWRYTIRDASDTDKTGVAEFKGAEYRNVNDILKRMLDRDDSKIGEVRKWLETLKLEDGPRDSNTCNKEAFDRGFSHDLISKACRQMNIKREKNGKWCMEKPEATQQDKMFDEGNRNG